MSSRGPLVRHSRDRRSTASDLTTALAAAARSAALTDLLPRQRAASRRCPSLRPCSSSTCRSPPPSRRRALERIAHGLNEILASRDCAPRACGRDRCRRVTAYGRPAAGHHAT